MSGNETVVGRLKDVDWIFNSFLMNLSVGNATADDEITRWRTFSSADVKYYGTGLGENKVLNCPPGFTPTADIPKKGILGTQPFSLTVGENGKPGSIHIAGMGPGYSESIDDLKTTLHIRSGNIRYKGLVPFFTSFYDNETATLARYGRVGISYYFGKILGSVVGTIAVLPLAPFILAGTAWNFFMGRQSTKFAEFKPAQPLFWTRMSVMYNTIGANLGVIPRLFTNTGVYGDGKDTFDDLSQAETDDYKTAMHRLMPKFFTADGRVDVYNVANGGARLELEYRRQIKEIAENSTSALDLRNKIIDFAESRQLTKKAPTESFEDYLKSYLSSVMGSIEQLANDYDVGTSKLMDAVDKQASGEDPNALSKLSAASQSADNNGAVSNNSNTVDSAVTQASGGSSSGTTNSSGGLASNTQSTSQEVDADGKSVGNGTTGITTQPSSSTGNSKESPQLMSTLLSNVSDALKGTADNYTDDLKMITGYFARAGQNFETEWRNGAAFLSLAVNYTGAGTATFSNTLKEPSISTTVNGISQTARDARVSMADYQTGFGFIDGAVNAMRGFADGALDKVHMSGLLALAGNAFVDFQKQWDSSSTNLPTMSFTIDIPQVDGNPISRYLNAFPTIIGLLALAVPQSTGPQSYTAPSFVECYCQGVGSVRLGMISDLTIEHAVGNIGRDEESQPLDFRVSFTVADCSSIAYATIGNGFNPLNPLRRVMDDDNMFNDYLCMLSGMHMQDMIDSTRKLGIRGASRLMDYKAMVSPGNIASRVANVGALQMLNKLVGSPRLAGV